MTLSNDDTNINNGDASKPVADTHNIRVSQEEERRNNSQAGTDGLDAAATASIAFEKDSKLQASIFPTADENDCEIIDDDINVKDGIVGDAELKVASVASSQTPPAAAALYPGPNQNKAQAAAVSRNEFNSSESDEDSITKQQINILRTTPGAFAVNNPLSSSFSGNQPLLEQRPSLRVFTSRVLDANAAVESDVSDGMYIPQIIPSDSDSLQGSDRSQDLQEDLEDPESITTVTVEASTTPCLSAIRVGSEFEVIEGEIVREQGEETDRVFPMKQNTKTLVGGCLVMWLGIAVTLIIFFTTGNHHLDTMQNGGAEAIRTDDRAKESSETIHAPSGTIVSNIPLEQSKQIREYLLTVLAPISGPAGARVFDRSGTDTSMDRINALNWMVDDLASILEFGGDLSKLETWEILQRYILALLYFTTAGESWDIQSNFLSKDHECSWTEPTPFDWVTKDPVLESFNEAIGVSCNNDGRIQGLKLRWNDLSGTLPHELSYLNDTLEELDLGGGSISGTIPSSFIQLTKLKTLGLNDNCLSGTIPEGLSTALPHLERFNIINNGDLYGSLNGFCNNNEYSNEKILAIATECPLPLTVGDGETNEMRDGYVGLECDCCICCDRNDYNCYDEQSGRSWKSLNLKPKMMFLDTVKQFDRKKKCRTEANIAWIRENCTFHVPTTNTTHTDANGFNQETMSFECAADDSQEGTMRSIGCFFWY